MRRNTPIALLLVSFVILGATMGQPASMATDASGAAGECPLADHYFAGFSSPNMSIVLVSPANQSRIVGTVNITLLITSVNGLLNLTLFVDDTVYAGYNKTPIAAGEQNITLDTTVFSEGYLNFTFLLENETFTPPDRESYRVVFNVDNHGAPHVVMLWPGVDDIFTGLANLTLNITSDYDTVYMNVTVEGRITSEFNSTIVPVGAGNFTINGTRYENGNNLVNVKVWTEEGLSASVQRVIDFLDYVRIVPVDITRYSRISGDQEINIRVDTPYPNVTLSVYVDDDVAPDVDNITVPAGFTSFKINTTIYTEGLHNFTYRAYDSFGHRWVHRSWYEIDNHGAPSVQFVAPKNDVVYGLASFTINIDTTWHTVNLTVYVDGVPVEGLVNVTANAGQYVFSVDAGMYTKWTHTLKVVIITEENLTGKAERTFGFASMKIEEIVSLIGLAALAVAIPVVRKMRGQSIRTVVLVDALFLAAVAALFFALGVTSVSLVYWHVNLASIWAVGAALVFTNWVLPLVLPQGETESQ